MKITINQALRRIKKLKGLIAEDRAIAANANVYVANQARPFEWGPVCTRITEEVQELIDLTSRVAAANATNTITLGGDILTHVYAIKKLGEIKAEIAWLRGVKTMPAKSQQIDVQRPNTAYTREVQFVNTVVDCSMTEAEKVARLRTLSDEFDALNEALEKRNHEVTI